MNLTVLRENKTLLVLGSICLTLLTLPFIAYEIYYAFNKNEIVICFAVSLALLLLFISLILAVIHNNTVHQKELFLSYNKTLPNINYEDLVKHAKFYNKAPISKDSYQLLLKAREILVKNENSSLNKTPFSEKELKILSKVGRILFDNLEVELLIAKDDHVKLEKINEILIIETINKIRNSSEEAINSFNDSNIDNEPNDLDSSNSKKIH